MDEERFYKPKNKDELYEEMIESINSFEKQNKLFKEVTEELTFKLAVMSDGIKRYLKK